MKNMINNCKHCFLYDVIHNSEIFLQIPQLNCSCSNLSDLLRNSCFFLFEKKLRLEWIQMLNILFWSTFLDIWMTAVMTRCSWNFWQAICRVYWGLIALTLMFFFWAELRTLILLLSNFFFGAIKMSNLFVAMHKHDVMLDEYFDEGIYY